MIRVDEYPTDWPALAAQVPGQCPDLTGTFGEAGNCESKMKNDWPGVYACESFSLASKDFLTWNFGPDRSKMYSDDLIVELSHPDPRSLDVAVRIEKTRQLVDRRVFRLNPEHPWLWGAVFGFFQEVLGFDCELGGLRFKQSAFIIGDVGILQTTDSWEFLKANNGDLIMKESQLGSGLILGIPMYKNRVFWHHWPSKN